VKTRGNALLFRLFLRVIPAVVALIFVIPSRVGAAAPPSITTQPQSQSVIASSNAVFTVVAGGQTPLFYQWSLNGAPLIDGNGVAGSTTTNLNLFNVQANEAGSYQCVVTNNYGSDTSAVATLTLFLPPTAISTPGPQYVGVGNTAYFTVTASGTSPFHFQWQRDGTNLTEGGRYTGASVTAWTGETFDIANVNTGDSDTYQVVVTNLYGQATSPPVVLSVGYPPVSLSVDPVTETVTLNGTATFNAFIGGTPPFAFHWQLNGADIPADNRVSSTNETLVISPVEAGDAGTYTITRISNVYGNLIASGFNGYLTVLLPPSISTQPQGQSVPAGTNTTFSVSATSANGSITYQWYLNGTNIAWAQAASITLTNVQATNAGSYYAILGNSGGSVTSAVAPLTVQGSAPWFINPLPSQNAFIGQNVTLDPTARGSDPLSFQWELNGTNLPGATLPTLNIPNAQTNNSGAYLVIVTNNYGSATGAVATLLVQNAVQITGQPASQAVLLGGNVSFTVSAIGTALNYQWYLNGATLADGGRINGSATPALNVSNVQSSDAGGYRVVVSNLLSSATSLTASLTPQATLGPSVRYVMLTSTNPESPYLDWSTAATNIQDAIDAAIAGDSIVVSNGIYNSGGRLVYGTNAVNRVVINKPVAVESLNGPAVTTIAGFNTSPTGYNPGRCVYLTNGAFLAGFTLTRGGASTIGDVIHEKSGGAAWCEAPGATISNCVIFVNSATYGYGGGVFGGTVLNCLLATNSAGNGGAAASNTLLNCSLENNRTTGVLGGYQAGGIGGGAFYSTLSNCLLVANSSLYGGGTCGGLLFNCVLTNNSGSYGAGACSNVLNNCVLERNVARGPGGGAYNSILYNCTVVSNTADTAPGGAGIFGGTASNSIIYYNSYNGYPSNISSALVAYSCTFPFPASGRGNITNAPLFVKLAGEDFHLQSNSPCINSGDNAAVTVADDLDANPRIVGGTVDMGAYEYQTPASVISYAWLQQYGLPTDGSVDYANVDGTSFNVYQDWIAGLNPTNTLSVLAMLPPAPANSPAGLVVSWESVSNRTYFLNISTNLGMQPAFSTVQSNITGHAGTTSYTDTNAIGDGPFFYRVGVQ
jgi:hypothetical protein